MTFAATSRLLFILLAGLGATAGRPAAALDVALTNDDGWTAPGLQALLQVFERAGHSVTLAAPASQQSGSGTGLSTGTLRVRREAGHQYSVHACRDRACESLEGAEPATSALIAVDIATRRAGGRRPDVLISGINPGANTGGAAQVSGTVGAAIVAASPAMGARVPAIAVSTDLPAGCKADAECASVQFRAVAEFSLRLVEHLARQAGGQRGQERLLPPGMLLNVNHPAVSPRGVKVTTQGRGITQGGRQVVATASCAQCAALAEGNMAEASGLSTDPVASSDPRGSDTVEYLEGYITIVPIQADPTASAWRHVRRLLEHGDWYKSTPGDGAR